MQVLLFWVDFLSFCNKTACRTGALQFSQQFTKQMTFRPASASSARAQKRSSPTVACSVGIEPIRPGTNKKSNSMFGHTHRSWSKRPTDDEILAQLKGRLVHGTLEDESCISSDDSRVDADRVEEKTSEGKGDPMRASLEAASAWIDFWKTSEEYPNLPLLLSPPFFRKTKKEDDALCKTLTHNPHTPEPIPANKQEASPQINRPATIATLTKKKAANRARAIRRHSNSSVEFMQKETYRYPVSSNVILL
jgi:hypothetical protein